MKMCIIKDCSATTVGRGYCRKHYQRWWKYGDPLYVSYGSTEARYQRYTNRSSECWVWTGTTNNGYGRLWDGQRTVLAHRWAYMTYVGPIPKGWQIDHLCKETLCARPSHLEAVPAAENLARRSGNIRPVKDTRSAKERFFSRIVVKDGHWYWTARCDRNGYGIFYAQNKQWAAHRYAAHVIGGKSIAGKQVDHTCQVRHCVYPGHLDPVTTTEHARRTGARRKGGDALWQQRLNLGFRCSV